MQVMENNAGNATKTSRKIRARVNETGFRSGGSSDPRFSGGSHELRASELNRLRSMLKIKSREKQLDSLARASGCVPQPLLPVKRNAPSPRRVFLNKVVSPFRQF